MKRAAGGGGRGPTNVPYRVPCRAITPQIEECENLLVPVCFSATHLGHASARMEPVFMICGESAGIAACRAIEEDQPIQKIDESAYRDALLTAGQKLAWDPEVDRSTASSGGQYSFLSLIRACDRDGDELVSGAEWNAAKPGWEWLFAGIDSDKNGHIEESEYAAFRDWTHCRNFLPKKCEKKLGILRALRGC